MFPHGRSCQVNTNAVPVVVMVTEVTDVHGNV